ncbi:MAG: hypothetical protein WCP19_00910 [Chloroflexota bacterium]
MPSNLNTKRWISAITTILTGMAAREFFLLAIKLGISPFTSKTWFLILGMLGFIFSFNLVFFLLTFSRLKTKIEDFHFETQNIYRIVGETPARFLGVTLLLISSVIYPIIIFYPYFGNLIGRQTGMRFLLFWCTALFSAFILKIILPKIKFPAAILCTILIQAAFLRILNYFPDISTYPFSMGWSETSRFFYPSLFVSNMVYGSFFSLPLQNPTLHLLLVPPYLLNSTLIFHRMWQVLIRFLLVGLIVPSLFYRLKSSRILLGYRAIVSGIIVFLYLFSLPLYLHLAVPVFMILWGFSSINYRQTWFWLIIASIWAGLSRINWYPVPGMLAAALYFLEIPHKPGDRRYLLKPAAYILSGTAIAFLSINIYMSYSGLMNQGNFFTSLSSSLLWFRLLPNQSYYLGVLPAILLFSFPLWIIIFQYWRENKNAVSQLPAVMIILELVILFLGGIVVSMKIGGGVDIHNMDAYGVLLIIISAYYLSTMLKFSDNAPNNSPVPVGKPTGFNFFYVIASLIIIPAFFSVQNVTSFYQFDKNQSQLTLNSIQKVVDSVNSKNGEILFITQRHLITMNMLHGVKLIPEYEREDLMEMAMSKNEPYLNRFRADMESHRFAAIIVDPLKYIYAGEQDAMGAENNAWTRYVIKRILCSYQPEEIFSADRVAIYVPQTGENKCP